MSFSAPIGPAVWASPSASQARTAQDAARANAPYLARLLDKHPDAAAETPNWSDAARAAAIADAHDIAIQPPDFQTGMARLRIAKQRTHLAVALSDLSRDWSWSDTSNALTRFADASVRAAVALSARALHERGDLAHAAADMPGLAVIAMGKMGAHELNYSSDIDISLFYDPDRLPVAAGKDVRPIAQRIAAHIVRALHEVTPDGYVFRTDLRLRPDPASTPPAVTLQAAEQYYQSVGQNWERAAFIKARACAGDIACGEAFLRGLEPFIWRRSLDYAAVADILSIKRQILAVKGKIERADAAFDVKLGHGGIRAIELFAQTQQLILGGRDRSLRATATVAALSALQRAGVIDAEAEHALIDAYAFYRDVEHRIQMLEDAQTHALPRDADAHARLAMLCGFAQPHDFDAALDARRARVIAFDDAFFGRFESLGVEEGGLSFTGVEDDPQTLETLQRMGFTEPALVSGTIRGWHHGRIRAMRAERARELLTAITPALLRAVAQSGDADGVFARFADFFAGLSSGVTLLALFQANPQVLEDLAGAFAAAPRLAQSLARRPAMIDAMLEARFAQPLRNDDAEQTQRAVREVIAAAATFEDALNAARRAQREEALRISIQVLSRKATAGEAGAAYADLADACIAALDTAALQEVARAYGDAPGTHAIVGLGKLGGREMSEGSDLDLMLVYDAPDGAMSSGARAIPAGEYYARVTQRLVSALSAPTQEGPLYDVDMQLRPSGSKGPVAVRLSSFARYYREEAWTWELLALTRLRVICGDGDLAHAIAAAAHAAVSAPRDWINVKADVLDMRARMARERPARGVWDLKLAPGGFVDLEFIAQAMQLKASAEGHDLVRANTREALAALDQNALLPDGAAGALQNAWGLYSDLQQILRAGLGDAAAETAPKALRARLAAAAGLETFEALEETLAAAQRQCRGWFEQLIGAPGDGTAPPPRVTG